MLQRLTGTFRQAVNAGTGLPNNLNVVDGTFPENFDSFWTPGATLIDNVNLSPLPNQKWSLLSVYIRGYPGIILPPQGYGKLGKIYGGLLLFEEQPTTQGPSQEPYQNFTPLPSSLLAPLWDPNSDPLPTQMIPGVTPTNTTTQAACQIELPQPLDIQPGQQLRVGMWIMPSLFGSAATVNPGQGFLLVTNANYTVQYDDGT